MPQKAQAWARVDGRRWGAGRQGEPEQVGGSPRSQNQPRNAWGPLRAPLAPTSVWELGGGLFSTQQSYKSPEQPYLQLGSDLGGMSHCDTQPRVQVLRGTQDLAQRTPRPQGMGPGEAAVQDRVLPSLQGAHGASA